MAGGDSDKSRASGAKTMREDLTAQASDTSQKPTPAPTPEVRRFYTTVAVVAGHAGPGRSGQFAIELDGRSMRTPGRAVLAVPSRGLAQAIAKEWDAQETTIKPHTMPLTRLANTALDGVVGKEDGVAADIAAFAGSDLVCYRAEHPQELIEQQANQWDRVIAWAQDALGAGFVTTAGIMPIPQSKEAVSRVRAALIEHNALQLTALHVITTLTGSALMALAHVRGGLTADEVWRAAHVDEDWQISQWGEDAEAAERRGKRQDEFRAACHLLELCDGGG